MKKKINNLIKILKKPENIFLLFASVLGTFFVFTIQPGWNSDESAHYYRIEQIADGHIFSKTIHNQKTHGSVGFWMDKGSLNFISKTTTWSNDGSINKGNFGEFWHSTEKRDDKNKEFVVNNNSAIYPPVAYLPQVLVLSTSKPFVKHVLTEFILIKIAGLLIFLIGMYITIRLLPFGKWIMMTIGLLPTTIIQASAVSADSMTITAVCLLIALSLHLAFKSKEVSYKSIAALSVIATVVGLIKPAYFPVILMPLVIPIMQWGRISKKKITVLCSGLIFAIFISLLWLYSVKYVDPFVVFQGVDYQAQITNAMYHPIEFLKTVIKSYVMPDSRSNLTIDHAFINAVWEKARYSFIFTIMVFLTLFASVLISEKDMPKKNSKKWNLVRALSIIVFVGSFLLINLALYAYFTPYKNPTIYGVQFRYLIPILFLALYVINIKTMNNRTVKTFVVASLLVMNIAAIPSVLSAIYI